MNTPGMPPDWRAVNLAMWDERVGIHTASEFYDLPSIRAGRDPLRGFEIAEVGAVAGKRLVHLQCHIGTDTLGWARRGAGVIGLDFSAQAVAAARELAVELGQETARFVESDVYSAVDALGGEKFDIVYTGLGALCWLPDLTAWAQVVADLLAPNGFLYLAEFHPIGLSLGEDGTAFVHDYFDPDPIVVDEPGTYADHDADTRNNVSVEWQHPLGEVISAVAAAGLRIEFLHEHDFTLFECVTGMVKIAEGYRLPADRPRLPLMYSLRASR